MQRFICPDCLRPARVCWCAAVRTLDCATEMLILQHPQEKGHAKNTALLLCRCLARATRLEVGEHWDDATLAHWLHGDGKHSVLLYPPSVPDPQLPLQPPPTLPAAWLQQSAQLRLVVLDGTWRKSRKMLYQHPLLQQLPRLALQQVQPGRYHIRKAQLPSQLSTFEAGALALAQLGAIDSAQARQLDQVFTHWLQLQPQPRGIFAALQQSPSQLETTGYT